MRRRHWLTLSGSTLGGVLIYGLDRKPTVVHADPGKAIHLELHFFTEKEARVVAASATRIFLSGICRSRGGWFSARPAS
jgi:hypothetical protein